MPVEPNDPRVQAALREYLQRLDGGERVNVEAFIAEHGDISSVLRLRIADVQRQGRAGVLDENSVQATQSYAQQDLETVRPRPQDQLLSASEIQIPEHFGRYRIVRTLGRGAMGTVYLADDAQLTRQVALKTPHFRDDPTGELLARFYREARAAATLRHPNLCPVYDVGQIDGKHFISMAYIEGRPLSDLIQGAKSQSERQILIAIRKLAQALQEAHEHGIVHRDLKPGNIMVDKRGEPIIMDFGLAHQVRQEHDIRLTQSGALIGTPAYMSPEQVEGDTQKIGPLTDQYSLGVILYELLTGQLPFRGSLASVLGQIVTKTPTPPSHIRADLDLRIESVCLKMMSKDCNDRFPSLAAVAGELASILKQPSARATSKAMIDQNVGTSLSGTVARSLTQGELGSLENLASKCFARRDYEQVVQVVEQVPEEFRTAALQSLLAKARHCVDEIAYLIVEIDDAVRVNDRQTALQKADELLGIKPGHYHARQIKEEFSSVGILREARVSRLQQFTRPWNEGGWIPWSVLGFGFLVFAVMTIGIQVYLRTSKPKLDRFEPTEEPETEPTANRSPTDDTKVNAVRPMKVTKQPAATLTRISPPPQPPAPRPKSLTAPFEESAARNSQQEWARFLKVPVESTNSIGMKLVVIPPGEFQMGSKLEQVVPYRSSVSRDFGTNQLPQHRVRITQPYFLGAHEVTRGEFAQFVNATGYKTEAEKDGKGGIGHDNQTGRERQSADFNWRHTGFAQDDTHPVVNISRNDVAMFCAWLSKKEGKVYRLPTEAEWEYACRAGTTTAFSFGDDRDRLVEVGNILDAAWEARFSDRQQMTVNDGYVATAPVGSFRSNSFRLFDMHGNVWEWCHDWYQESYYSVSPPDDPKGPSVGELALMRGGAFECPARLFMSANRSIAKPSDRAGNTGFRVACNTGNADSVQKPDNRPGFSAPGTPKRSITR